MLSNQVDCILSKHVPPVAIVTKFHLLQLILVLLSVTTRIWDNPFEGQIRLTGGSYSNRGLVEVYCNGQWGTVCDDGFFDGPAADIVCKQLGYTRFSRYSSM